MALTTFDKSFSYRQDTVARLGETRAPAKMTNEQRQQFQNSPFMKEMQELESAAWSRMSQRDKMRQKTDPNFKPKDTDFDAPKAHPYVKTVDYYKVLGVDEYSSLDEIKKVYKKLSLAYHPDKTGGMTQAEKDERAAIFIEVKNAYKVLSDAPTRRQYDFDRDKDAASKERYGDKGSAKEEVQFDAKAFMAKLQEKDSQKLPSETVDVYVKCKLEKFIHGGHKAVTVERRVKLRGARAVNKDAKGPGHLPPMEQVERLFRLQIPPQAQVPFMCTFRNAGNMHHDRESDTLRFVVKDEPNNVVARDGVDLHLRDSVEPAGDGVQDAILFAEIPSLRGRHYLVFGENPSWETRSISTSSSSSARPGAVMLNLHMKGQGLTSSGSFHVKVSAASGKPQSSTTTFGTSHLPGSSSQSRSQLPTKELDDPFKGVDPKERCFLERFNLGPPQEYREERVVQALTPSQEEVLRSRRPSPSSYEVSMEQLGPTMALYTNPPCVLTLLSNRRQRDKATDHRSRPPALFALSISSPACGRKRGALPWQKLLAGLVPVLSKTLFSLIRAFRELQPKSLAKPRWQVAEVGSWSLPALPVKRMGDEAFRRGDVWQAMAFYTKALDEVRAQADDACDSGVDGEASARLLSNRAACLGRVGDWAASLSDAKNAVELAPTWARGWSRIALAAEHLSEEACTGEEAVDAALHAVELEPSDSAMRLLFTTVRRVKSTSLTGAQEAKENGNVAWRNGSYGLAIAWYTTALALLPPEPQSPPQDKPEGPRMGEQAEDGEHHEDEHALFRAVLHCNRSAAFLHLKLWSQAIEDGKAAVWHRPAFVKARSQLATALLSSGQHERAYVEFAKCLQLAEDHPMARKGRSTCLQEIVLRRSVAAMDRIRTRCFMDARRRRVGSRVFAISEVHFDSKPNEAWVYDLDNFAFQDDVLIVAGNVAGSQVGCLRGLQVLKSKFRRVFFTMGNYEMNIQFSEVGRFPDSLAKMLSIYEACDEMGVDVAPAVVCEGVTILPLQSWYNSEFDEEDPFPDPNLKINKSCKWPIDADSQVWRYMAKLNEKIVTQTYEGIVITVSHFLPRRGLQFRPEPDRPSKGLVKTVGNEVIDEQLRFAGSRLHVFGHGRQRCDTTIAGVKYVSMPLLYEKERGGEDAETHLLLVFDGRSVCSERWGPDGIAPDGVVKRLLYVELFRLIETKAQEMAKLNAACDKLSQQVGVEASLQAIGSKSLKLPEMIKADGIWPRLEHLRANASHVMLLVADDVKCLQACLHSQAFKAWQDDGKKLKPHPGFNFVTPLGQDLQPQTKLPNGAVKDDPCIAVWCLRLNEAVSNDSEPYEKMQKAVKAINNLPNSTGRIAASLQPAGFGPMTVKELFAEMEWPDDRSYGFTHELLVQVNSPESLKLLLKSKTFEKWCATYAPFLVDMKGAPGELGFIVPLVLQKTAAAPRDDKSAKVRGKS